MSISYNLFVAFAIIIYLSYTVNCQECVTFDFENIPEFEHNSTICGTIDPWNVVRKNISDDFIQFNNDIIIFPTANMSCMTTKPFHVDTKGILQVNMYLDVNDDKEFVAVIAKRAPAEGDNMNVGATYLSAVNSTVGFQNIILEWNVEEETDIYLVFLGRAMKESKLYIKSYRYIPPNKIGESCHDQENNEETTTEKLQEYDESNEQLEDTDNKTESKETDDSNNAFENSDDSSEKASSQQNDESNEIVSENYEYLKNDAEQSGQSSENNVLRDSVTVDYMGDKKDSIEKFEKSLWQTLLTRAAILMCVIGVCVICWYFLEFGKSKIKARRAKHGKELSTAPEVSNCKDEKTINHENM